MERETPARRTDRLLAVLVVIAGIGALRISSSVSLPFVFALFLVAVTWPIFRRAARVMPRGAAAVLTFVLFVAVVAGGGLALYASVDHAFSSSSISAERLRSSMTELRGRGAGYGLDLPDVDAALAELKRWGTQNLGRALAGLGAAVLVCAYLVLALTEVSDYEEKLRHNTRQPERWKRVVSRVARDFQRYVAVRTSIGLLNGVLAALSSWAIGLDLALVWGVVSFVLNYIPTLGSIAAVVAPVVFALVAESPGVALLTLGVLGALQLVLGNWIDPLLQGRYLRLSPLIVLLAVVFWGWVWGVLGAFIGVPLTVAIVLVCREFESTRWIAELLGSAPRKRSSSEPRGRPDLESVGA